MCLNLQEPLEIGAAAGATPGGPAGCPRRECLHLCTLELSLQRVPQGLLEFGLECAPLPAQSCTAPSACLLSMTDVTRGVIRTAYHRRICVLSFRQVLVGGSRFGSPGGAASRDLKGYSD